MLDKKEFGKIRKEIADFDVKRESIIQQSREIINVSKRIIYAVHRDDIKSASTYVKDIEKKKKALEATARVENNIRKGNVLEFDSIEDAIEYLNDDE